MHADSIVLFGDGSQEGGNFVFMRLLNFVLGETTIFAATQGYQNLCPGFIGWHVCRGGTQWPPVARCSATTLESVGKYQIAGFSVRP